MEGVDAVNRVKLLMGYDMSKTLTENKEKILTEQRSVSPSVKISQDITKKLINALSQTDDDEEGAFNQIKRINTLEILKNVDNLVKKRTGMSLKNYIDDEMSNTFDPEYRKIMDHIDTLDDKPSYQRQGFDQPNLPIFNGVSDTIKDETGTIPYSQMRTKLTPEYKKKFQKEHPEYVWDPNYESTRTWISNSGKKHEEKIKTGGFVRITPENVGLRGTPFGFHPTEYQEYLKKVKEINKKYPKEESKIYDPKTWFDSDVDETREKLLQQLKNQYYHKDFPYGITKQDFADHMKAKKEITKQQKRELDSIENSYKGRIPSLGMYPDKETIRRNRELSTKKSMARIDTSKRYKTVSDYLDAVYEYDPYSIVEIDKSAFEKWWDEWGSIAELALWILADFATDGAVLYLTEARQAYLFAKIVRFAGRVGLPVGLGIADTIENGHLTENGIVDFMFAVLPWAHTYFGIAATPSVQLVESIVSKRKGLNLRNPDDVRKYMRLLTEEEKGLFRQVARLTKRQKENGIKEVLKELDKRGLKQIYNTGKTVEKTTGKSIKPSIKGKINGFVITVAKDLTAIEIAKKVCSELGLLDDVELEKRLAEEFSKRKGTDLLVFMANVIKVIQKYPKLNVNGIISKSITNELVNNVDDAIALMFELGIAETMLEDENGNKLDNKGNIIKK